MKTIDLNADIGESMPYDEEILKYVSSCNIACGGHIGDETSILKTIDLAIQNQVKIGAHPSYPDQSNFGRISVDISIEKLLSSIDKQLKLFEKCIKKRNSNWSHIKFHGALYNDLIIDKEKSIAIANYLKREYSDKILFIPPNSEIKRIASKTLKTKIEGFADRAYNSDLSLLSRRLPNAVLNDKETVINQVKLLVINGKVRTIEGLTKQLKVETICLHGDTPKALELIKEIVKVLKEKEISIQ
jgi:UPF0271 protein